MVEETQTESTNQVATESTWEEREEQAKSYIKNDPLYSQVVYISNDDDDCFPIPFHSLDYDLYPYVIERPTGINRPKYNWNTRQWEEMSAEGQATKLNDLVNDFENAQKEITALKEKNESITKENTQLTEQLKDLKTAIATSTQSSAQQSAQLIKMLSMTTAKIDALATNNSPQGPTVSAAQQPTSQATETQSVQADTPVATSDDTKKEGE